MDPITLFVITKVILGAAGAAAATSAVIHVARLTLATVLSWFHSRTTLSKRHKHRIAFTVMQGLKSGRYGLVQGVFDTRTRQWVESREIRYDQLDKHLAERHRYQEVVQYHSSEY